MGHFKYYLLLLMPLFIGQVYSLKILFLSPLGTRSETILFKEIIGELSARGHDLTWVTSVQYSDLSTVNQYSPITYDEYIAGMTNPLFVRTLVTSWSWALGRAIIDFPQVYYWCDRIHQMPQFVGLFQEKWDLIMVSGILHHCFMGHVSSTGAPFIFVTSTSPVNSLTWQMGSLLPPSTVPNTFLDLPLEMTTSQRVYNTLQDWMSMVHFKFIASRKYEDVYRRYLGEKAPPLAEIEGNASILLTSSHFTLHPMKPLYPDIIEIGGAHCRPGRPLPEDLERWMGAAPAGIIYFSLGSLLRGSELGDLTSIFLKVFAKLAPIRVLWKWETSMDNVPDNIKLIQWAPQQDILAHNKTRLFMTHGGTLSLQEAIYHAVPILGTPIFFDQDANLASLASAGMALKMDLMNLNEIELEKNIRRMLNEERFQMTADKLSNQFRDQPETPLDRAIFWTEYVIRHKGAAHLRPTSRQLNWVQYTSLDVIAILLTSICTTIYLFKCLFGFVIRKLFYKSTLTKLKKQ